MANVKPLRLKRQKSSSRAARELNVPLGAVQVEVIVDNGVFHLDHPFSYLVKPEQAAAVGVGSVVKVPFRDKTLIGVVTKVGQPESTNLAYIEKLVASNLLTQENLDFAKAVATRYVSNLWDVIRLLLPPLNQSTTYSRPGSQEFDPKKQKPSRTFYQLGFGDDPVTAVCNQLTKNIAGSQLVIVPTERLLSLVIERLNRGVGAKVLEYGAHLSPSMRRKAFTTLVDGQDLIVIGLRSSIFAPIKDLKRILILNEFSEHHYELRAPYWNTRDVALLRSEYEGCDLNFFGSAYSAEIARLASIGWVKMISNKQSGRTTRVRVECAPVSYNSIVRDSLKNGSVLFSVAGKEFASGFLCEQCKNSAVCSCHGRLMLQQRDLVACAICDFTTKDWQCSHCGSRRKLVFKSGAKKVHEEIGKAFPKIDVFLSTSDKALETISNENCLVVATAGMEPKVKDGYAGIVLLDGEQLLSRHFIRAEEELFQRWMSSLQLIGMNGSVYSSLPQGNKITQSLMSENSERFYRGLLNEREETLMPPFTRVVKISADSRTVLGLRSKLENEYQKNIEAHISNLNTEMIVKVSHESAADFLGAIKAVQKLRSASGKDLLKVQVDPYSF